MRPKLSCGCSEDAKFISRTIDICPSHRCRVRAVHGGQCRNVAVYGQLCKTHYALTEEGLTYSFFTAESA